MFINSREDMANSQAGIIYHKCKELSIPEIFRTIVPELIHQEDAVPHAQKIDGTPSLVFEFSDNSIIAFTMGEEGLDLTLGLAQPSNSELPSWVLEEQPDAKQIVAGKTIPIAPAGSDPIH